MYLQKRQQCTIFYQVERTEDLLTSDPQPWLPQPHPGPVRPVPQELPALQQPPRKFCGRLHRRVWRSRRGRVWCRRRCRYRCLGIPIAATSAGAASAVGLAAVHVEAGPQRLSAAPLRPRWPQRRWAVQLHPTPTRTSRPPVTPSHEQPELGGRLLKPEVQLRGVNDFGLL